MHKARIGLGLILLALQLSCAQNSPVSGPAKPAVAEDPDLAYVRKRVLSMEPQLKTIYTQESVLQPQEGSVKITIRISDKGWVDLAELHVLAGNLSPHFLNELKSAALKWRFAVDKKISYHFKVRFTRKRI